ncbi:MAG: CoA activase [Nitrospirae bacterium]|nr:CoA activase [Nitrospirota bacterium]
MRARRYLGIDIGAEAVKLAELVRSGDRLVWSRRHLVEHHKKPWPLLGDILRQWEWEGLDGVAVTGRLSRQIALPRVPTQQAQAAGCRHLRPEAPATLVSIGSHGFSVLELRASGTDVFRENSRCSQGTGNFLCQLVGRFGLTIEEAGNLCADVQDPAPLSGRCPVILKTDMTHLANKGENRARILAGLFDAVCENVQVLIKPALSPPDVILLGGVSRSPRVRDSFRRFLAARGMRLLEGFDDDVLFFEALGCAVLASEQRIQLPPIERLAAPSAEARLERVPALTEYLGRVKRLPQTSGANGSCDAAADPRPVVLGLDIGSTGSKAVAVDARTREVAWEAYTGTNGDPVGAARLLMRRFAEGGAEGLSPRAAGVTGSGREIVGSLLTTCYGADAVYVLNEIAAHAEGALHFDPRVDTIFEIGGQDAKYIRLASGRVVDAAMNEACSAGTGSFIEEQGRKFDGIRDVVHLGEEALQACDGVSLGQHCSVFMAEVIDEATAAGESSRSVIAGIYDSIIQNYLNRVKGPRSVGRVIFCQGMPFSADALAAAVARQTGSEVIVPPNPGTVGALGIALLALKEMDVASRPALDPARFLAAQMEKKDTFVCKSSHGCGEPGNRCRIDRITAVVESRRKRFTWGGGCSMHDKGTRTRKLPDLAPDPFREREDLVKSIAAGASVSPGPGRPSGPRPARPAPPERGGPRVALTDEFLLKSFFPFFATFLRRLGFNLSIHSGADQRTLKRGIEEANLPFCAPMHLYHGLVGAMAEEKPDILFLPMLRSIERVGDEPRAGICPIVQASPDVLRLNLGDRMPPRIVSTVIDVGRGNLRSKAFLGSLERLTRDLGVPDADWREACHAAMIAQEEFEGSCLDIGRRALAFCEERDIVPVVVLGRTYTIYNKVLNSNVPAILREQGAIAIPVDCFPVGGETPVFKDMFWGYGQRILRAAHEIRRTPRVYSLFCSNYACGPDSFNLHFYAYAMGGKPFSVIETDGHSGDAGTKTRVEAFLHCVREDLKGGRSSGLPNSLKRIEEDKEGLSDIRRRGERVLIPRMGPSADVLASCLRGIGVPAESLPLPDHEALRAGRRHTSGKECIPMCITLGSLLKRLEREGESDTVFSFFMPTATGPCRFGMYHWLHKITLERLGWKDRVRVWSPADSGYFDGVPSGFSVVAFTGFMAADLLLEALYEVRPTESRRGAAREIHDRYERELFRRLERECSGDLMAGPALLQVANGLLFGCAELLRAAAQEYTAVRRPANLPTVLLVGEIYVRCDPFANDFVVDRLEERGLRIRFAPFTEWLEYSDYLTGVSGDKRGFRDHLLSFVQSRIQNAMYNVMARAMGWRRRTSVRDSLAAASDYIRPELHGEAVLTLGGPIHEWREGLIDGVVSVGPHECMPNKIAEAQFFHVAEREGLASLTLALNGDPVDPVTLDRFAFEVHRRFRARRELSVERPAAATRTAELP